MATRILLASLLLILVATSAAQRGREVRRRNRQSTTTTTTPVPSIDAASESPDLDGAPAETSEGGDEKQICEGEPGCQWRCADQPDPSASCTCFCAPPENPKEESSYDGSYFNK